MKRLIGNFFIWSAVFLTGLGASAQIIFTNPVPTEDSGFGSTLAALGNGRVLIGEHGNLEEAGSRGRALLFTTAGRLLTTFTNPIPQGHDGFGFKVAVSGENQILIGAPFLSVGAADSGLAFLFDTNATLITTFTNPIPEVADRFGSTLAALGPARVVIGAMFSQNGTTALKTGAAYVFSTNGTLANTITNPLAAAGDRFGSVITVLGSDLLLIGAPGADLGAPNAGAVHLMTTNGTVLTTFTDPVASTNGRFGYALAAAGLDRVLIGKSPFSPDGMNHGRVCLFSTNGTLLTVFTNPFPSPEDAFGVSVTTARDDLVLIGAPNDGTGALNAGAAYLFETNGALLVALTNPAPANGGYFGVPVAAAGRDRILVGKQLSSEGVVVIGAAFLYDLQQLVPPLAIARNAANVAVRWPGPTGSFVLQNSSQLGTAASWSDVAELVITQAPTNILTQPLTNTNRFYRLRFR